MNTSDLLDEIVAEIYTNGDGSITGAILQGVLTDMMSMDWRATGILTDGLDSPNDGTQSIDVQNRILYNAYGVALVDFSSTGILIDSSGTLAQSITERFGYDFTGSASYDYGNRLLYGPLGENVVMNWNTMVLYDNSNAPSLDTINRITYQTNGNPAIEYSIGVLISDGYGTTVVNTTSYTLNDYTGTPATNFNSRYLINSDNFIVGNWNTGVLSSYTTSAQVDWYAGHLLRANTVIMDWDTNLMIYDNSGNTSIAFSGATRYLSASGAGSPLLKWGQATFGGTQAVEFPAGTLLVFDALSSAAAPGLTTGTLVTTSFYGTSPHALGQPTKWLPVVDAGGTQHYIPAYH